MARFALLFLALTFTLAIACDRGVPSNEEAVPANEELEGGTAPGADTASAPAAPAAPSAPTRVNSLPSAPATPDESAQTDTAPSAPDETAGMETAPSTPATPGEPGSMAAPMHPAQDSNPPAVTVAPGSIEAAEGGLTVADIFAQRDALAGKSVTVRGKVVKVMQGVMGTNWYHIADGTGDAGTNDLVITSNGTAKIGDTVLVVGTLASNKDLGMGYHYDAIVEQAELTIE